jgi:hypothetical protein
MSLRAVLLLCALAVFLAVAADAARIPVLNAASATSETLSPPEFVDGYCRATAGAGVTINTVPPARLIALPGALGRVRYVGLTFIGGATSTRLCYQIGDQGQALDCTALGDTSGAVLTSGATATFAVARDFASGDAQEIFAEANAGTDGFLCISWGY